MVEEEQAPARSPRPNEDTILHAALAAFAESGYNGATMRGIVSRARTSLSNLYNYWPVVAYARWRMAQQTAGTVAIGELRYLRGDYRQSVVAARGRTELVFDTIVEPGRAPLKSGRLIRAPSRAASSCSAAASPRGTAPTAARHPKSSPESTRTSLWPWSRRDPSADRRSSNPMYVKREDPL